MKRYQSLQATIEDRLEVLRDAMTAALDLQDQLDMLLKWLDQAENDVHKMEKGTLLVVQKEPLIENSEAQQVSFESVRSYCYVAVRHGSLPSTSLHISTAIRQTASN